MLTLFFPGVFLGAVIGFIFGALLVAELADDAQKVQPVVADTTDSAAEVVYDGGFHEPGCTEAATIVTETLDDTELRHRIYRNGEGVVDVTTDGPMVTEISENFPDATFIAFYPSGVGGYIPYAGPHFLYRIDHCTGEVIKVAPVFDDENGMVTDVSEDGTLAAFVSQGTAPMLGIRPSDMVTDMINVPTWTVSGDYTFIGDATISPDNQRIAFAVANGPENEGSEVMLVDTKTGVFTSVAKSGAILHVFGWNEDGTVDYHE